MTKIYLDLSEDIRFLLEENQVSLGEVLANAGIDRRVTYEPLPYQEEGARTKELVTLIIVASAAAVLAVGFAISQVVSTLQRKPYLVEIEELQELRDAQGNVLLDAQGQPVFKKVKEYKLLEPRQQNRGNTIEIGADPEGKFIIKMRSDEKQMFEPEEKGTSSQPEDKKNT